VTPRTAWAEAHAHPATYSIPTGALTMTNC
jgi:hypothetical protein